MHHVRRRLFDDDSPQLDRFGPLLLLTVGTVGVMSLVNLDAQEDDIWERVGGTLVSLAIGLTLVLAVRASGVARRWRRLVGILVVVTSIYAIVILIIDLASDADLSDIEAGRPSPIWVVIAVLTPPAVIHRLLQHSRVTVGTLLGAVAAYLLIAIAFAYTFNFVDEVSNDPFFAEGEQPTTAFMYFSLVTITTLGYGDLAAESAFGRLLSTSEAVIGQVYLVTFVAILVGLLIQQRQDHPE